MSARSDISSLTDVFQKNTVSPFEIGLKQSTSAQPPITFENLFPDVDVSLPPIEVPDVNVNQAHIPDFNVEGLSSAVDGVKNTVLDKVEQVQNFFTKSLQQMHGHDVGNQMMGKALACGGTTLGQAAISVLDPTPGVIAIAMAVHSENKGPKTPEIEAAMDEVICRARQNADNAGMKAGDDMPTVPQGLDLENITGKQMYAFFQTPVEDLPIMRKIAECENGIDRYQNQKAHVQENGHQTVNDAKIAVADEADLARMAGSEAEIGEFLVEHVADMDEMEYGAGAVEMVCSGLEAPGRLAFSAPEFPTQSEAQYVLAELRGADAPVHGLENSLKAAATAFRPNESSMMG